MRKHKSLMKQIMVAVASAAVALSLVGCGAGKSTADGVKYVEGFAPSSAEYYEVMNDFVSLNTYSKGSYQFENDTAKIDIQPTNRKLIKNAYIEVETKDFDNALGILLERVSELGGYVESMNTYNGSSYRGTNSRNSNICARIPQEKLQVFLDNVGEITNITRQSEDVRDVTLAYVDLETHAKSLEIEQNRLLELLSMAENLDDILKIEGRLSEVRYQIESMKSTLKTYDNQIDYSTVNIDMIEVLELTPVKILSTGERITSGFANSLKDVKNNLTNFFVDFIVNLPHIFVFAIIAAMIITVIVLIYKSKRAKKLKKVNKESLQPEIKEEH